MKKKAKASKPKSVKRTSASSSKKTISKGRKAAQKVKSAAAHISKTTKKIVDDVFLKIVGMKVLERAQAVTKDIKKEKKAAKGSK